MDQTDSTALPDEISISINEKDCLTTSDTTPLLPSEENVRCSPNSSDTTDTKSNDKKDLSYVYALFSFILFLLVLYPYIFFVSRSSSSEINSLIFTSIYLSCFYSCLIVREVLKDDNENNIRTQFPMIGIAVHVLLNGLIIILCTYEHGFKSFYAVPVCLTLIPICYIAYHLTYILIYSFGTFTSSLLSSVS